MTDFISRREFSIEWAHCDPTGIAFNSRFFEFFDWGTWTLFEAALGVRPSELASVFGIAGIPLVDAGARFLTPARFGNVVEMSSRVREFRRASFDVEHCLFYARHACRRGSRDARVDDERCERFFGGKI
jgi:4-hydroxybenzoyl-CoA thioesterase